MSGTSLDAIDICYVDLVRDQHWSFHILKVKSIVYSLEWKQRLSQALHKNKTYIEKLNQDYTQYLANVISDFIKQEKIHDLLAVCSHGHTVFHKPQEGYTLQIGNLPAIASLIGVRTVCDFRVQDVLLKGQGAPLVPIGDELLFTQYEYCLNLGGFANISSNLKGNRIAYDIAPVNVVLNHYALLLGQEYDDKGAFAKAGTINPKVLKVLNNLDYYQQHAPKSLGMEWVNHIIWDIMSPIDNPKDALATFTEHVAIQVAAQLTTNATVLVTGGGAYNEWLIKRIGFHSQSNLVVPEPTLVEYKEALIFAFLGVLRLRNEDNCLSSVTGATRNHSSGEIYIP